MPSGVRDYVKQKNTKKSASLKLPTRGFANDLETAPLPGSGDGRKRPLDVGPQSPNVGRVKSLFDDDTLSFTTTSEPEAPVQASNVHSRPVGVNIRRDASNHQYRNFDFGSGKAQTMLDELQSDQKQRQQKRFIFGARTSNFGQQPGEDYPSTTSGHASHNGLVQSDLKSKLLLSKSITDKPSLPGVNPHETDSQKLAFRAEHQHQAAEDYLKRAQQTDFRAALSPVARSDNRLQAQIKPPQPPSEQSLPRHYQAVLNSDLDYDMETLRNMDFETLRNEEFDEENDSVSSLDVLLPWLANALDDDNQDDQYAILADLTKPQWEEVGKWLQNELEDLSLQFAQCREEKRKIAMEMELEVARRRDEVQKESAALEEALSKMRKNGAGILER